ncbi:DMT family transporter [Rouxiella silvae]|uniref:DMT family transporter n=1 Tax=Rouxiella silvae TaxID=1646373 RepID=A0AA40X5T1_9GAMM|nr:DMT family transporter [Rouxiella silvae]MBF6639187.1 DMT family transporter [Rouxiella silvae]
MFAFWMLIASAFFALMGVSVKLVANQVGFIDIIFYRSFINMLIVLFFIKINRLGFKTNHFKLHMKRAVIGNFAMYSGFYALIHLPIATATTLGYTNPIFQSIITFITNKKQLSIKLLLSVFIGFAGILVLLHPDTSNNETSAAAVGLLSGLLTALAYFNVGKLVRAGDPELRVVFYFSLVGSVIGGILLLIHGYSPLNIKTFINVCAIGVFGSLGQISMTRAYGRGSAIIVSILSYSTIIFSTGLGYFLFGELLTSTSILGILLIVLSGIIAIVRRSPAPLVEVTQEKIIARQDAAS